MKAREITINVPITIKLNADGEPEVDAPGQEEPELQDNPVMVGPLQQELELKKAAAGKSSPVIDKLLQPDDIGSETDDADAEIQDADTSLLDRIKQLMASL